MNRALVVLLAAFISVAARAEDPIAKPIRYTWIATSCETLSCAASALMMANGDKHVIVLPTGREERPWVILRRVEEGSIFIPEDEPFRCETFSTVRDATSQFGAMASCLEPILLSVPDGRIVITSLAKCGGASKRRAVRQ